MRGVIEGQSGWLLDGVASMQHAAALSEDPSVTLQLLREGCVMAAQAGAIEEAVQVAARAADITPADEIDSFTGSLADRRCRGTVRGLPASRVAVSQLVELVEDLMIGWPDLVGSLLARAGVRIHDDRRGEQCV